MATRSAIALQTAHGFRAVYCHWDGYPSHQLPILQRRYNTARTAAALIAPGDISSLETEDLWDRSAAKREPQPLYYCERGETNVSPRSFATAAELMQWADGSGCEHVYTYQPRKGWAHCAVAREPLPAAVMPGVDPSQW